MKGKQNGLADVMYKKPSSAVIHEVPQDMDDELHVLVAGSNPMDKGNEWQTLTRSEHFEKNLKMRSFPTKR